MPNKLVIIFSRAPGLGQVKTRLARAIGAEQALAVHQKLFYRTLKIVGDSGFCNKIYLSAIPAIDFEQEYTLQEGLDLGARMANALKQELKNWQRVVLIGSDCLNLTGADLEQAFNRLADHDLVLGPATDGGYYLVGMKKFIPNIFRKITWGSNKVLHETLQTARADGLNTYLLETRQDVDTVDDLPENWKDL